MAVTINPAPPWPPSGTMAGRDLSCIEDIFADGREVTGRQGIAEAVARRLITYQGALLPASPEDTESPAYGYNLRQWINADVGPADIAEMGSRIEEQALAEETVLSARATVTFLNDVVTVVLDLQDRIGPFRTVLTVTDSQLVTVVTGGR